MAGDMFLKLEGIKGEAQDDKHKDEIDVLSWSWGATQSGTTHMGSGSGGGRVSVMDLSITKYVDKASTPLLQHCCNGKHIPSGKLTVRKAGGDSPVEYLKVELTDIIVTSVQSGGAGGEDRVVETASLNFGQFKFIYTEQTPDGSPGAAPEFGWDIAANVAT